jgi:hypothetical protein
MCEELESLWSGALPLTAELTLPIDASALLTAVNSIHRLPLPDGFIRLIRSMFESERIATAFKMDSTFTRFVVKSTRDSGLVTKFVFMSGLYMKNHEFHPLCSRDELMMWYRFEEVMLDVVESSTAFSAVYHDFEDDLLIAFALRGI